MADSYDTYDAKPFLAPDGAGRTVPEVVEDIGYGRSQLWTNVLVNGTWLADGAEALMISALTKTLASSWDISPSAQGALSSVVYAGTGIGSVLSGWLGDVCGRRVPLVLCFPLIIVFSLLSACSTGVAWLMAMRFFVGFGFGVGQPNAVAMLVEISPVKWRALNQGLAQVAFGIGELYACLIIWMDDPNVLHLHWRWALVAGAIPALLFWILAWLFLQESPAFLAQDDLPAAKRVLDGMRRSNGSSRASVDIIVESDREGSDDSFWYQLQVLLKWKMFWTTLALCFICFAYNLTIYGAFYALPQLLPDLNVGTSAAAALALGALIEIPFDFLGLFVGLVLPRKTAIGCSLFGLTLSLVLFAACSRPGTGDSLLLQVGYYGLKGFPQITSLVLYVFTSEAFPVNVRSTGTAIVLGIGRVGAILASMLYAWLDEMSGGHTAFFYFAASLVAVSAALVAMLPEASPEKQRLRTA